MKFKYAIKGMLKNKLLTLFLIIQLMCGYYVLYISLLTYNNVQKEADKITRYFNNKKVYEFWNAGSYDYYGLDKKGKEKQIHNLFDYVINNKHYIFTQQINFPILLEVFNGCDRFKYYPPEQEMEGRKFFHARNIVVNKNTINQFNIKVKKGRLFLDEEYAREYGDKNLIPVILGANYEGIYNVGDEIIYYNMRSNQRVTRAKVVGMLEKNQFIPSDMSVYDLQEKKYVDLNNCILTTNAIFPNDNLMYGCIFGYNFMLFNSSDDDNDIQNILSCIKDKFNKELGFKVDFRSDNQSIRRELDTYKSQLEILLITTITILSFITTTFIISLLNSIIKRKREFGIHIFSGGTLRDIALITYLEVFITLIIPYLIALIILYVNFKTLNFIYILWIFTATLCLSILISIIPIIKIFKLQINDLIKGVE